MKTKKDRNGNTTSYSYDIHERQLSRTVDGPSLTSTPIQDRQVSYTYDNNENPLTVSDKTGTTTRTYDELNRTITKSVPKLGTNTYQYDETIGLTQGFRAEVTTDVKGNVTRKVYDKTNRLVEVKANNDPAISYTYYNDGSRQSVVYPSGIKEEYTYTQTNHVSTLKNFKGTTLMDTYTYTYDAAGNQLSKDELINGVNKGKTTYAYDALNRLQTVLEPGGKQTTYSFDAAGNRIEEKVKDSSSVKTTQYEYNDQNRLTATRELTSQGSTQLVNYKYDNNGNMINKSTEIIKKIDPQKPTDPTFGIFVYGQKNENPRIDNIVSGTAAYEYDAWNQLSKSSTGEGTVTYEYNGDGLRTKKISNGVTSQYVYESDKVVLETDGSGKQSAFNLYGTNLLTRKVGDEKYSYLYNGHADVTALVNDSGEVKASYYYDAFGNIAQTTGNVKNSVRYAGYQYDEESKLYYLNARYYDPSIARFMSEDTYPGEADDPLSLNLYSYVSNEPIMYSDPTGHWKESDKNIKNVQVQAQIIALTSAYFNAKTPQEKKAIEKEAVDLRKSDAAKRYEINPLMYTDVQKVVDNAVALTKKGNFTDKTWNDLLSKSNITSTPITNISGNTTTRYTETVIGRTVIEAYTDMQFNDKKHTAELKGIASVSYTFNNNEAKFLEQAAKGKYISSIEQGLAIYDFMNLNKGTVTETDLKQLHVSYGSADNAIEAFYKIFHFARFGLTISEAVSLSSSFSLGDFPIGAKITGTSGRFIYSEMPAEVKPVIGSKNTSNTNLASKVEVNAGKQLAKMEKEAAPGAHFYKRHGAHTTLDEQYKRATTGVTPDGVAQRTNDSSRFLTNQAQLQAIQRIETIHKQTGKTNITVSMGEIVGEGYTKGGGDLVRTTNVTGYYKNGKLYTVFPNLNPIK